MDQYQWQEPGSTNPSYPPCLAAVPEEAKIGVLRMFDMVQLIDAAVAMSPEVPMSISAYMYGEPLPKTLAQIEARMDRLTKQGKNIGSVRSIANRKDWYTDAVFAQQSFTGSNPTTITNATSEWVKRFMGAANSQGNKAMHTLLSTAPITTMYVEIIPMFARQFMLHLTLRYARRTGSALLAQLLLYFNFIMTEGFIPSQ